MMHIVGTSHPFHLRIETCPVSETLYSLEYWMMDKVKKPSNAECYRPSSKHFRIYMIFVKKFRQVTCSHASVTQQDI
jgi:hypothetical protein